jgi:hypothetical protein
MSLASKDELRPSLIDRRWKDIKSSIFSITKSHRKYEMLLCLLTQREEFTFKPNIREITNFVGYDLAMNSIASWNWKPLSTEKNIENDANEIGRYGSELMILHSIKEAVKNGLLNWNNDKLIETERGKIHFDKLNSYNVDVTGASMDRVGKQLMLNRLTKQQKEMDPLQNNQNVKNLYGENSILMLLRVPLPFYQSRYLLSEDEISYLLKFHKELILKSSIGSNGVIRVRLKNDSITTKILRKLSASTYKKQKRPKFIVCIEDKYKKQDDKVEFHVGLGALTMFAMFLASFDKDRLLDKAMRFERVVQEVIEQSENWKVVESNRDIVLENGEIVTEIDIIAKSTKDTDNWITCEVKDFSFWKGWIYGYGGDYRKEYYEKAVGKLPFKEKFIMETHNLKDLKSIIVTSIPESYHEVNGVSLIYISDLIEFLEKILGNEYVKRKQYSGSNYLVRYFDRLFLDYSKLDQLLNEVDKLRNDISKIEIEVNHVKKEYDSIRDTYEILVSEYSTLDVTEKLAKKRLLMDKGENHYELEDNLKSIKISKNKVIRERNMKAKVLHELRDKYDELNLMISEINKEVNGISNSKDMNVPARGLN